MGGLDFSSLLTSDHKKGFTPLCFAASCVDVTWSRNPDCITSTERNIVYTVLLLSPLLFIYLNGRWTSRDKGEEPASCPGCILSAGFLNTRLWLWSLPPIQQAAKSTGDGDRDRPLRALSTGQWAADKSHVCLARLNSSSIPLVLAFLPHSFETFGSAGKIMSDLEGIPGQHDLAAGV